MIAQNKSELLDQLKNTINNLVFGLAGVSMTSHKDIRKLLSKQSVKFDKFKVEFGPLAQLLNVEQNMHVAHKQFMLFLARGTLVDAFVAVQDYAERNNQMDKVIGEPIYV